MSVDIRAILPSLEEMQDMGRRRMQHPSVFKTDSKRPEWYFRARVDVLAGPGRPARAEKVYYLGFVDEMGKREAERSRDAILGEAINQPQVLIQSQVRFSQVIEAYRRDHLPTLRAITRPVYEIYLKRAEAQFGRLRMCDITAQAVQAWANGLPARQKRMIVGTLGRVWNRARAWGYTQTGSPTEFVVYGQKPLPRAKSIPTQEQYTKLRAILPSPLADMADVAVSMGLRISEIRGMPVRCVDLQAGAVRIEQRLDELDQLDQPKSFRGWRAVPMGALKPMFLRAIAGKKPADLVFQTEGYHTILSKLKDAAAAIGCDHPGFGWHTFRRCHNTWIRKAGASTQDAMDQLGHSSAAVNDVYMIAEPEDFARREKLVTDLQSKLIGPAGRMQ